MSNKRIHTKFGIASLNNGYYVITSRKEGNNKKKLHRLIYEDYYKVTVLSFVDVHHIDGNKLNNSISNLELLYHGQHQTIHKQGQNNPNYGKSLSKQTRRKMSEERSSTGFYRVHKHKDKNMKQGFIWRYEYYNNGKRKAIGRASLMKLKQEVLSRGLDWIEY